MIQGTTAAPAADARRQVISFMLQPELFGIELDWVEKVIEVPQFYFVPRSPSFIRGAINNRGKVIAVVDLREFLCMDKAEPGVDSRVMILASEDYHLGFIVDRVERIELVPVRGPLVQGPEPGDSNPYINRMINMGGRILSMFDMEKLLLGLENYFE